MIIMKRKLIIIIAFLNVFYMFGQFDKGFNDGFTQTFREANLYEYAGRVERNISECNHKSYLYNGEKDISFLAKEYAAGYRCGVSQASKLIPKVEEKLRNPVNTSNSNISNNKIGNNTSSSYDGNQEILKMQQQTKEYIDNYTKYTNQLVQSYKRTPLNYGKSISLTDNLVPSFGVIKKEKRQLVNNNSSDDDMIGLSKRKDWVIAQNNRFIEKDMKIEKEILAKKLKETKENENLIQKAKGYYEFNQLIDGWYEIFIHYPYKSSIDKKEYNVIRKTFCYVENKQMIYYINADKLLQKVVSFSQSSYNQCNIKFQYPNLQETGNINFNINIINPNPQTSIPQYEIPSILALNSTADNIGNDILFIIHSKDLGLTQSRLIKSYEVNNPNCYSKEGVYKFYLPKGNYEYCAVSENYLKFWTSKITIDDNCELINITN